MSSSPFLKKKMSNKKSEIKRNSLLFRFIKCPSQADPTLAHHLSPASWSYLIPGDLADVLSTGNNNNYDNGVYPQEAALQEYWEAQIGADPGWSGAESSEYSPGPDDLETESESPDIRFKLDPTAATRSPSARSPTYSGQTPSSAGASSTIPYSYTQRGVSSTPSTSSKSTSLHPSTALHASDVPRTASGRAIKQNRPHADFVRDKAKAVRNDTGDVFLRVFDMVARHSYADADLLIGEAVKGLKSELAGLKVNQSEVDEWERAGEQEGRDVAGQVVELTRRVAGSRTPGRIRPEPRRARPSFGGQQPQSSEFHQDSHYPF
ncbi:hypothetical protein DFS34DRAFT_599994 [Phlyctochytrium arcticum]|nr:hypothetical protein DFS34DRAFT_599994 [Phlyctochytrium arcticum]